MVTTFRKIKAANPCDDRYKHGIARAGGVTKYGRDTPITALQILECNGLDDLLWCWPLFGQAKADRIGRIFACDCADRVRHLMTDERSTNAIDVARRYANGEAPSDEFDAARAAAWAAARDADGAAARAAARAAAWAAARAAAWAAAGAAAGDAAGAAAGDAAGAAAGAAAWAAAWDAERKWQRNRMVELLGGEAAGG